MENSVLRAFINHYFVRSIENFKFEFYYGIIIKKLFYRWLYEQKICGNYASNIKLPTYYVNESFVRLIPFKDHINVEAAAILNYKDELSDYKITPKGMLQIFINQDIPFEMLNMVFVDTLIN